VTTQPPSGQQLLIRHGAQRATIVEVGGGPREYAVGDWHVLDGYPVDQMCDGGRGQPLLPWPNRLEDGDYTFAGQSLHLPVDERDVHNAIHGLTRWANWAADGVADDRVTMRLALYPRPGYPFTLALAVQYQLDATGLTVRTTARNDGPVPLPFGAGYHPYVSVGTERIDDAELLVPARSSLEANERKLPTGRLLPVEGTEKDFRQFGRIGRVQLDTCFTDLVRGPDGLARVRLRAANGHAATLWLDGWYEYLMVYTGDTLAPPRRRQGLAVEPMTCPANAYRTGVGLRVLAPGESSTGVWGIQPGD